MMAFYGRDDGRFLFFLTPIPRSRYLSPNTKRSMPPSSRPNHFQKTVNICGDDVQREKVARICTIDVLNHGGGWVGFWGLGWFVVASGLVILSFSPFLSKAVFFHDDIPKHWGGGEGKGKEQNKRSSATSQVCRCAKYYQRSVDLGPSPSIPISSAMWLSTGLVLMLINGQRLVVLQGFLSIVPPSRLCIYINPRCCKITNYFFLSMFPHAFLHYRTNQFILMVIAKASHDTERVGHFALVTIQLSVVAAVYV